MRRALAIAVLLAACKGKAKDAPGEAPPPDAKRTAWRKDSTQDCPAYVRGSKVQVVDTETGVQVIVTSDGEDETEQIREHAVYLQASSASGAGADALRFGDGPTGDRNVNCPVVLDGTHVVTSSVPGGAVLDVTPKDPAGLDALRKTARERLETLTIMKEALDGAR